MRSNAEKIDSLIQMLERFKDPAFAGNIEHYVFCAVTDRKFVYGNDVESSRDDVMDMLVESMQWISKHGIQEEIGFKHLDRAPLVQRQDG